MTHRPTDDEPVAWNEIFRGTARNLKAPAAIIGIFLLVVGIVMAFTSVGDYVVTIYMLDRSTNTIAQWDCGSVMAPHENTFECADRLRSRNWQVVPAVVVGLGLTVWGFYRPQPTTKEIDHD